MWKPCLQNGLTDRQEDILSYIYELDKSTGVQPTLQEICDHFGISSKNGVAGHLQALEAKGWIVVIPRKSRSIQFLKQPDGKPFRGFSDTID
jgi:repressor LexA